MEFFYREMRRASGLLMDGDEPAGGQWNFDHDNRKALPKDVTPPRRAALRAGCDHARGDGDGAQRASPITSAISNPSAGP